MYARGAKQVPQKLQALVGECAANTADEPESAREEVDLARVEVYYNGLGRVVTELEERFMHSSSAVTECLSDVVVSENPKQDSFAVDFYNLDLEDLKLEKILH